MPDGASFRWANVDKIMQTNAERVGGILAAIPSSSSEIFGARNLLAMQ
jgi:hypothetical protein